MADQSKMHRLEIGDKVAYRDESEWPPLQWEGEIKSFENEELTYIEVEMTREDDKGKTHSMTKVLTEDDVTRI